MNRFDIDRITVFVYPSDSLKNFLNHFISMTLFWWMGSTLHQIAFSVAACNSDSERLAALQIGEKNVVRTQQHRLGR